jgi:large subunit ribosomal protein L9
MDIILLQDVKSLGKKDDLVKVSEGYAKNFLIKKGLGIEATPKNRNDLKLKKQHEEKLAAEKLAAAQAFAEELRQKSVTLSIKTGSGGRSFGSVSTKEITQAAKDQLGLELDKKKMQLDVPIKMAGTYQVQLRLHAKVTATLQVVVKEG